MVLIEDSRQQMWAGDKHRNIHDYCERAGIEIMRTALPFGDYCLIDEETGELPTKAVYVDTKQDITEISGNIMNSRSHVRFKSECIKAQEAGCQLVILIEEVPPCGLVELWTPPTFSHTTKQHKAGQPITRANPVLLGKCMRTMTERYGVRFTYCEKSETGRVLLSILQEKYQI